MDWNRKTTRNWIRAGAHCAYVTGMTLLLLALTMTTNPGMFVGSFAVIVIGMYLVDCLMFGLQGEYIDT